MQNMFSLEGKVALVTGAAYGIGFAIAEALAGAGAKIAFNCRGQEHMDKALADYRSKGIEAHGYLCDVTNEADVERIISNFQVDSSQIFQTEFDSPEDEYDPYFDEPDPGFDDGWDW
jgi:gluconate 5-dehydrogenase